MYKRSIENQIKNKLFKGKLVIIYGARQVGKTTLAKKIILDSNLEYKIFTGDSLIDRQILSEENVDKLKKYFEPAKIVLIDEAQMIDNIGSILKSFVDKYPEIQIIATGSSAFNLKNKLSEPMTGRYFEFLLFPLSILEITESKSLIDFKREGKEEFSLRFGFYPEIESSNEVDARLKLLAIQESTLYKDLLALDGVRKPELLQKLIKTLAFNIGSTLTIGGLAKMIATTNKTVEKYLDILEKMFVIKRLNSYSRNMNNELKRSFKIYFIDIGLRNSVIQNHNTLENRNDIGGLFENFWIMERIKSQTYNQKYSNRYFWQTYGDIEIDYLEESDGNLTAFECKWTERKSKGVKIFEQEYKKQNAKVIVINKENYLDFL